MRRIHLAALPSFGEAMPLLAADAPSLARLEGLPAATVIKVHHARGAASGTVQIEKHDYYQRLEDGRWHALGSTSQLVGLVDGVAQGIGPIELGAPTLLAAEEGQSRSARTVSSARGLSSPGRPATGRATTAEICNLHAAGGETTARVVDGAEVTYTTSAHADAHARERRILAALASRPG